MKPFFIIMAVLLTMSSSALSDIRYIPQAFNYQASLADEGGNPLPDGSTDIKFQILNSSKETQYEEEQQVEIINGKINTIIGNGVNPASSAPTGGIPPEALDPSNAHYLRVEVASQRPYDPLEIVAVPYAMWADTALRLPEGAITGKMIANGTITKDHLDNDSVEKLILSATQKPGGAANIGVSSSFVHSGAKDVEGVLKDIDIAINSQDSRINFLEQTNDNSFFGGEIMAWAMVNNHKKTGVPDFSWSSGIGNVTWSALNGGEYHISFFFPIATPYMVIGTAGNAQPNASFVFVQDSLTSAGFSAKVVNDKIPIGAADFSFAVIK